MSSVIDFVSESLKKNPLPRQAFQEELPSGWKRIESRTKPGTYYYAHPATNRTQVQPPSGTKQVPANGEGQKTSKARTAKEEEAQKQAQLAADKEQERKRKHKEVEEEAEAEEELVEEEKRRIKAARKAKELELKRKAQEAARLEKERKEREAKLEKERLQREAEELKRKQELEALAEERRKKEAEARAKEHEAQRRKAMVFEQHSILQRKLAEDARKRQAEEEEERRKKALEEKAQEKEQKEQKVQKTNEAEEAERKAKAAKMDAKIWNQRIPDMVDPVSTACFEVFKLGKHLRTHVLGGDKSRWIIGRGPAGVDIAIGNPRISRKHAEITTQGPLMFLNDLGSTYGTAMNKEKLEAKSPVELVTGARFRFGGLPELYVYREPVEEEEEPSSPPVEAEVTGTAYAEDAPDLPPPVQAAPEAPAAPEIDAEAAAEASAAAKAVADAEDEARIKRIQQKRQERKAAEAAEKAQAAAKKEEERRKKQERNQKKRAAKEAKAAKKAARAAKPAKGVEPELTGEATPPDAPLPDSCMATPPEEEPDDLNLGDGEIGVMKPVDFF
ncbi:unnamed protein product [Durusdinium trenchii]|uniref:FHA domain-containing protein n=2 Tax=Durusdinium trenchii TaxID=1381693 RepID=A0ABP0QNX5_9DINO